MKKKDGPNSSWKYLGGGEEIFFYKALPYIEEYLQTKSEQKTQL